MLLPLRALLPLVAWFAASAQPTFKLNVRQVLVPVVVTDAKGHSITGLHPSDFHIAEDGVPQEIVAFTREIAQTTGASSAPSTPASPPGITVTTTAPKQMWVICFDALHTSFANFARARDAIEKVLSSRPAAAGQFVLLSIGRELRVLQPATTDLSLIRAKVSSKAFTGLPLESNSQQLTAAIADVRRRMDLYCSTCPCGRDANNRRNTCDVELQRIKQELDGRSEQFGMYDTAFFAQLQSVIAEFAKLDGHRNLILISDGFTLMPGRELLAAAGAYVPNSPYFKDDPARSMQSMLDQSLKIAAARDIVVNTIDARGAYSPSARPGGLLDASNAAPGSTGRQEVLANRRAGDAMRGGSLLQETDSKWNSVEADNGSALSQLAKASGGLYLHGNNDLQKSFREALADTRETYVLAYVPANSVQDGKFRQITVTVTPENTRAGSLLVRAKQGYWAENPPGHP